MAINETSKNAFRAHPLVLSNRWLYRWLVTVSKPVTGLNIAFRNPADASRDIALAAGTMVVRFNWQSQGVHRIH